MKKVYKFNWECDMDYGIHAAQAAALVQAMSKTNANILIVDDANGRSIDAKSILGLLSMAINKYQSFSVWVEGTASDFDHVKDYFSVIGVVNDIVEKI
jgi:phosphotransferase system HPr (HPr) family protein